jgi:sigma-B regulation protein RsbU (phosphoserine phosphatase)
VGLVYLDSKGALPAFDQDDLGLVTAIASVAAVKIHHARLLKDSLEGRELQEEIRLAAEVQAHLLPGAPPEMPGWSLGALSRPSQAMGGDYYDWHLRPDRLCLALADVAGKGTAAALLMAAVRALVRARWCDDDLAGAAERISRDVWDNVPRGRYATAFLGQLDPATGRLAFVNAGHPPPAVVRASGRVEWLTLGGLPLGMMESGVYGADEVTLHSGDTLLVFSDGVCEARGPRGDELGASGLVELVRAGAGLEAPSLATAIGQVLEGLSGFGTVDDDRTLLVLRRR